MKALTALAIAGGAVAGYMLITRKGGFLGNVATSDVKSAPPQPPINIGAGSGVRMLVRGQQGTQVLSLGATPPPPAGTAPTPTSGSIGAKDIGAGIGAAAAVAACAGISSGIGTAAAPLCGSAGAYVGGKAVDAGKAIGSAAEDVGHWVKGLF